MKHETYCPHCECPIILDIENDLVGEVVIDSINDTSQLEVADLLSLKGIELS
ncbi:hypothetical protein [Paenibacillus pini]|uniref:Uncharacterized protein n=1 Tax=Paenibacillus pini JCM 16418 TaxID=1236976 RepID=W7Z1I6_9BACL|nr:hypothetical protein [Paenibacillus pini]GAF10846.1 hypothetical protein JCM16418_5071 [Paenibacillus pini JCM 16418]